MPPRSTMLVAVSKAAFVNFSAPVVIGVVPANSTVVLAIPVPKGFKPNKPTYFELATGNSLEQGLTVSGHCSVTGNTPNYVANVRVANITAASITSAAAIGTIYQE